MSSLFQNALAARNLAMPARASVERRLQVQLPVQVEGKDALNRPFVQSAHTLNVSERGACIGGLERRLRSDDLLRITHNNHTACFRVAWTGPGGATARDLAGLCAADPHTNIWEIDFAQPAQRANKPEQRISPRYRCTGSVSVWQKEGRQPIKAAVTDISEGGCYIEMEKPFPIGTDLSLLVNIEGVIFFTAASVRHSTPGAGMGVSFSAMNPEDEAYLRKLILWYANLEKVKRPNPKQDPEPDRGYVVEGLAIPPLDEIDTKKPGSDPTNAPPLDGDPYFYPINAPPLDGGTGWPSSWEPRV